MLKEYIPVPKGIRFMSQWTDFTIPDFPHIMNKTLTGCGFTEYFLRPNPKYPKVILISPRRVLLENKEEQHNRPKADTPEEVERLKIELGPVYYARNDLEIEKSFDIDMGSAKPVSSLPYFSKKEKTEEQKSKEEIQKEEKRQRIEFFIRGVQNYVESCWYDQRDIRIIVTYDSFRLVKEALGNTIYEYQIVVDEFHTLLPDSVFKSDTELELLHHLSSLQKVCFLSATPLLDRYLERLTSFKDLPYYELNWEQEQQDRVINPEVDRKQCISIVNAAKEIIDKYLEGKFEKYSWRDEQGIIHEKFSTELVVYCNSVKNICDIIKKCNLVPSQCNILCANLRDNEKRLKDSFKSVYKKIGKTDAEIKLLMRGLKTIGKVPLKGEQHKMFTFCTRTVFLGADFYSKCARSLVLSDANIKCLTVDISTDFLQILGRQRDEENPWRNSIMFRFKTNFQNLSEEEFNIEQQKKEMSTDNLLLSYNSTPDIAKSDLAGIYQKEAAREKYKDNYVSVNKVEGGYLVPCKNELVIVAERRAFDLQSKDYSDRLAVMAELEDNCRIKRKDDAVSNFIKTFESKTTGLEKVKVLCEFLNLRPDLKDEVLINIPMSFRNYYTVLGPTRCWNLGYQVSKLEKEYQKQLNNQAVDQIKLMGMILSTFKPGERYTKSFLKGELQKIYDQIGLQQTAKANDIENWFNTKRCRITIDGKKQEGFELSSK